MADIIATGTSGYATGSIDTATTLINGVSPRDAKHPNGCAAAVVQVEQVLGSGPALKGSSADLATRLNVQMDPSGNICPVGSLLMFGGSTAPTGWLVCDGTAVSRTTFATLFGVIGVTYGVGNGTTTFNVPDMRGRVPVGSGTGSGLTPRSRGVIGGSESITTIHMPTHRHPITDPGHGHSASKASVAGFGVGDNVPGSGSSTLLINGENSTAASIGITNTDFAGSGAADGNTQPFLVVNYIIRT